MDTFIARQPIFDTRQAVSAYELLFRGGPENFFPKVDGSLASSSLVHSTLHVFGLDTLAAGKHLFINVTREVLLQEWLHVLPPGNTTFEILETVEPDEDVIAACRSLKEHGYSIALDDFVFRPGYEPLIELADIIKVDFLQTLGDDRRAVIEAHRRPGLRFLAEKIESRAELEDAAARGYDLFQGYFFCRPEMMSARDIPPLELNYLRLLRLANQPEFDFRHVEQVLKQDVSLSVRLLRYLNSAGFGLSQPVSSILRALTLLGERHFRRWLSLAALVGLGEDRPHELVVQTLLRARFCELLAPHVALPDDDTDLFLVGMLSLVDAFVGRPLEETLTRLAVTPSVRHALLHRQGTAAHVLDLVTAYEHADWPAATLAAGVLGIRDETAVPSAYEESVRWVANVFEMQ